MEKKISKNFFIRNNTWMLSVIDIALLIFSYFACVILYLLLKEQEIRLWVANLYTLSFLIIPYALLFNFFGLYRNLWQFMSLRDLFKLILVLGFSSSIFVVLSFICTRDATYLVFTVITALIAVCLIIFSKLLYFLLFERSRQRVKCVRSKRLAIIGAGQAGVLLVQNIMTEVNCQYLPICFIDDDIHKVGKIVRNVKVAGTTDQIVNICSELNIDEIVVSVPSATFEVRQRILEKCFQTRCKVITVPYLTELLSGQNDNLWRYRRQIDVEDLLERASIKLDTDKFCDFFSGKIIMITGGGGSIGSELCRQIAKYNPKKLIIVDIYENNAYDIQQELIFLYKKTIDVVVEIASVRDYDKMEILFAKHKPSLVYHAAAHKHVPLMENNPDEAIKNNVFGTYNLVNLANKYEVDKFILISSDKAVHPANVMGATKRMCEMIIQSMKGKSKTKFLAVRFGNVLGSNGSVIPLFKKQIELGGPVRVTSRDIIRYFMTIPEAVSLVMMAGVKGENGSVYVLDMGAPVKIDDLARKMIILAGFVPDKDIKIEYTGLRPGEKMYEELLFERESFQKIDDKIFIESLSNVTEEFVKQKLTILTAALADNDTEKLVTELMKTVYNGEEEKFDILKHSFEEAIEASRLTAGRDTAG